MRKRLLKTVIVLATCMLIFINTPIANGQDQIIPVTDISIVPERLEIETGQAQVLSVYIKPDDATDKTVTWRSFDEEIATVDNMGVVTGVRCGTTLVEASAGNNNYAYCIVRVVNNSNTLHKVTGRVFSGIDGSLMSYAYITLTDKMDLKRTRDCLSSDGRFEFDLKNGIYTLEISDIQHGYLLMEIEVEDTDIDLGDIFLEGSYIRGFVTSQGRPLEGVLVYAYVNKEELRWCFTDENGFYCLNKLVGDRSFNIEISDPNYVPKPVKEYLFAGIKYNIILNKPDPLKFTVDEEYKDDLLAMALTKLAASGVFTNPDYLNISLESIYDRASDDKSGSGNSYIWDGHGNLPVMRSNGARWADLYDALGLGGWKAAACSLDEVSGFLGTVFYNKGLKTAVITYGIAEGSSKDGSNNGKSSNRDYSNLFSKALEFYDEVCDIKALNGYKINFLTGYGPGGSLAEYVSLCKETGAITFNTRDLASVLPKDLSLSEIYISGDNTRRRHVNHHCDCYNNEENGKKHAAESIIPAIERECFGHDIQLAATIIGSYISTSCDNTDWAMYMESMLAVKDGQFSLTAEYDCSNE